MKRIATSLSGGPKSFDCDVMRLDDALDSASAESIFRAYLRFLSSMSLGSLRSFRTRGGAVELRFGRVVLLRFVEGEVTGTKGEWLIRGGVLAAHAHAGSVVIGSERGVRALNLVAFEPRIATVPWVGAMVYRWTQARSHVVITKRFLARL